MRFRRKAHVPKHRARSQVGEWRPEDEELLLKTYGKTSEQLADEAEAGYDLKRIRHAFVGADRTKPCVACAELLDAGPHQARTEEEGTSKHVLP